MRQVWTIGHSNHPLAGFLELLTTHQIECVADVRRFPASRRYPHFGIIALPDSLQAAGIAYQHFPDLGGRRAPRADSRNTNWKNDAFRGYADYMETPGFSIAIRQLMEIAGDRRTAVMCAEALWWQCHRSLIGDHCKAAGWSVLHILTTDKTQEHPYTSAARIVNGKLEYEEDSLF